MAGRRLGQFALALAGLIAWAAQFTVIYGATSVVCERGLSGAALFGVGVVPLIVAMATLLAFAATAWVFVLALEWSRGPHGDESPADRFLADMTLFVSGLSLVAILWQGFPGLLVPACF